jgi:REP element-mobilizing transposase RayT
LQRWFHFFLKNWKNNSGEITFSIQKIKGATLNLFATALFLVIFPSRLSGARILLDGVPLHIVQRRLDREACFLGEDDYFSYLHWLGEALTEHDCSLHAYVLRSNHLHLLMTPKKAEAVPKLLISIGRRYAQYVNRLPKACSISFLSRSLPKAKSPFVERRISSPIRGSRCALSKPT